MKALYHAGMHCRTRVHIKVRRSFENTQMALKVAQIIILIAPVGLMRLYTIIHSIHRFKLSDWLKGHMTWIILDIVHVGKLIHGCYFYYSPDSRRSCHSCRIWSSIAYFPDFMVWYGLENLWMGCIKQILTALLFGEWWKMIVPSVKFNLGLLFILALQASVNSRPRLNFTTGTIIFHHSSHEQSIFVSYTLRRSLQKCVPVWDFPSHEYATNTYCFGSLNS